MSAQQSTVESPTVVVAGLGRMGLPIALRLRRAGFAVRGIDSAGARRDLAEAAGVSAVWPGTGLLSTADVLITVLPGPPEVRGAFLEAAGEARGWADDLRPGALWLDLTSNDPAVARHVSSALLARGVASVGAPMSGGVAAASDGTLRFLVGGAPSVVATAAPLLTALGGPDAVTHVGAAIENGYVAKLLVNSLWFAQASAVAEASLVAQANGIAPAAFASILASGPAASAFITDYLPRLLAGDYLPEFGLERVVEELDTVNRLAAEAGVSAPVAAASATLHHEALARFGAVPGELLAARLLEERAGASLHDQVAGS